MAFQRNSTVNFVKNYDFAYPQLRAHVTFTCVAGHIMAADFGPTHRPWASCDPFQLFEAPIERGVEKGVCFLVFIPSWSLWPPQTRRRLRQISNAKLVGLRNLSYGPIAIGKERLLAKRYRTSVERLTRGLKSSARGSVQSLPREYLLLRWRHRIIDANEELTDRYTTQCSILSHSIWRRQPLLTRVYCSSSLQGCAHLALIRKYLP